jgi:hypothetical protein
MYNPCLECQNRYGHSYTKECDNTCNYTYDIKRLKLYEDTGLTPQEIEQMKARMPLHQWAGESPDKMSIFGVSVAKIIELTKAEKEGRLVILSIQDIHPCRNCGVGWGSISSEGCHSCEETCVRLKEYNDKYNT